MSRSRLGASLGASLGAPLVAAVLVGLLVVTAWSVRAGGRRAIDVPQVVGMAPSAADVVAADTTAPRPIVSAAWVNQVAAAQGVPAPAVRAYGEAALLLARESPGCHLGWTTLAGIGWIESQHGTIGDRSLLDDGHSSTPVLGPALDGSGAMAAIAATPTSTTWHGDPTWDHAVGPMQFLSSTWARWGSDGDNDGLADPLDIDDAAFAAGRYLCADGRDLATASGWNAAVFSYNHAAVYVRDVFDAAQSYAR